MLESGFRLRKLLVLKVLFDLLDDEVALANLLGHGSLRFLQNLLVSELLELPWILQVENRSLRFVLRFTKTRAHCLKHFVRYYRWPLPVETLLIFLVNLIKFLLARLNHFFRI